MPSKPGRPRPLERKPRSSHTAPFKPPWRPLPSRPLALAIVAVSILALLVVLLVLRSRPNRNLLPRSLLNDAVRAGLPACPRTLYYRPLKKNGFGSQALRMMQIFLVAIHTHAVWSFFPVRYWNYGCARYTHWSCYFERPTPQCIDDGALTPATVSTFPPPPSEEDLAESCKEYLREADLRPGARWRCRMVGDPESEGIVHRVLEETAGKWAAGRVALARDVARGFWRPKEGAVEQATRTMAELGILRSRFVGVHVRRGDKTNEVPEVPLDRYADAVRRVTQRWDSPRKVFVATDDFRAVRALAHQLGSDFEVVYSDTAKHRRGHVQNEANHLRASDRGKYTEAMLVELQILSRSNFFIGTFSSNFGRLVHVLRDEPPNTSISLDNAWAPGVAWHTFNTSYCDAPPAEVNSDFCAPVA